MAALGSRLSLHNQTTFSGICTKSQTKFFQGKSSANSANRKFCLARRVGQILAVSSENREQNTKAKVESDLRRKITQLKTPAKLNCTAFAKADVVDQGGEVSVLEYINLPPEQYTSEIFQGGRIKRVSGDLFDLDVPRLDLLMDVWVQPVMKVVVIPPTPQNQKVQLIALDCDISGSDLIKNMNINSRFAMRMETFLEFKPAVGAQPARMETNASLEVWCEIVPPFNFMPKEILESATNSVLGAVMSAMLNVFQTKVASDYQRWSTDAEYRIARQSMVAE